MFKTHSLAISLSVVALIGCGVGPADESAAAQAVIVPQTSFNFGAVGVGATSAAHAFTIQPDVGQTQVSVTAVGPTGGNCNHFVINPGTLPHPVGRTCQESCFSILCLQEPERDPKFTTGICDITVVYDDYTFTTAFRPTTGGTASCVVTVTWFDFQGGGTHQTPFTLVGTGV